MGILGLCDILVLVVCGSIHLLYRYRRKNPYPLPPRLSGWPIIGNALQIPLSHAHRFYHDLEKKLGSKIMYLEALGQPIVVINDIRMATELLEKRSAIYSSRPQNRMLVEVIGADYFFGLLPYGDEWRNHRRVFQQHFSPRHLPREQEKALEFIRKALLPNLYESPQDFREHIEECIGGISLSMTYGLPVQRKHDPFVKKSADAFAIAFAAASPGKYLVNVFPILKYVPEWLPGAEFKRWAPLALATLLEVMNDPFNQTRKDMEDGMAPGSFVSESLESHRDKPDFEKNERYIKQTASQVFGAAAETTNGSIMTFILAMLLHPEVQRKVQKEIDSVVGLDRLPDFSDRDNLPYLTAVLKEALRWNPIAPMGVPHATSQDDIFEGYFIPKGAAIMANAYAMLQDSERFPNPTQFDPQRFIKNGVLRTDILDPFVVATFGFGRRICPGSHIGLSALYIAAASIISIFDISPALDENGKPMEFTPEFLGTSLVSDPLPFPCQIAPRQGKNVEGLLQEYMGIDVL
ncbi:O-methylsterigmatocystin oxidoreductase [Leucoagaricus sp. SymC.cos]|nr:O-methylsterigmatocystin oxidoreductase [Leucoagaricus sp. SymC.cos]